MRSIVLFLIVVVSTLTLSAQQPRRSIGGYGGGMWSGTMAPPHAGMNAPIRHGSERSPVSEKSLKVYIEIVTKHLELSSKESKQFAEIYTEYYKEMSNLPKITIEVSDESTDEEIEMQILQSYYNADYSTALKRKYYSEFKKVLSVRQILMMYDVEREFLERINIETLRRQGVLLP